MRPFVLAALAILAGAGSVAADEDGKALFAGGAEPACTICHTLADAGSAGEIGPNLDELAPGADKVRSAVTSGVGIMPAYGETLSAEEIEAIAQYVAEVAGAS